MFSLSVKKLRQSIERGVKLRGIDENTGNLRNSVTEDCSR